MDELAENKMAKMEAALRMVLLFHGGSWGDAERGEWFNLQARAGARVQSPEATTKVLCDTIRRVLGN